MHLRFTTAGESHGKALVAVVEGLPAGLPVTAECGGPRPRPPDAGLRPRRPDEDRARPHRVALRGPRRRDARLAGRDADPQPRLGQLGGRHGARGRRAGRAAPPARHPAPARPRRPRRRAQVRPARRARHPRARQRPRDRGARGGRRAGQAAARRVRGRDRKPRRVASAASSRRAPAELPVPLNEAADRSEVRVLDPAVEPEIIRRIDAGEEGGRYPRRRGRGGGPRRRGRAWQPRELGPEARRPAGRAAHVHPRGEGASRSGWASRRRAGPGSAGARSDRRRARRAHAAHRRATAAAASAGRATTPAGSRAASPPASRWWSAWR